MEDSKKIYVIAFYHFTPIENPDIEVARHKEFLSTRDARARTYISREGINGQMSASQEAAHEYMHWLREDPRFKEVEFKIHYHFEHVFPRCTIKKREQIVALDAKVDLAQTGEHLSPADFRDKLNSRGPNTLLIDVRNDYEWKLGHFEGAELPKLEKFREFPKYAEDLAETYDLENTEVLMYCTGGIRCEPYSALLKQKGFKKVFQLQGGIIKYGLTEGTRGWLGKLFVFDDRLSVAISEEEKAPIIGKCFHCGQESEVYYNCANMDCNELFLACPQCAEEWRGCCSKSCQCTDRLRPFEAGVHPKPFRRWYSSSEEVSPS